jgi:hypothetical protein
VFDFAAQSTPTKLDDRFIYDFSVKQIPELKIRPLVTKPDLKLM